MIEFRSLEVRDMRRGFTMLELVFVIAVIGILAAVAIPKFAMTRSDAVITKAKTTVSAIRAGVAAERQKRILRGDYSDVNDTTDILQYGMKTCSGSERGCWVVSGSTYTFRMPAGEDVDFKLENNTFKCDDPSSDGCKQLTR
jgi:general secretion pathway protein G